MAILGLPRVSNLGLQWAARALRRQTRRSVYTGLMAKLSLRQRFTQPSPELISSETIVDEEAMDQYKRLGYYSANPGEVIGDYFRLKAKLGWGKSCTVWLAEDMKKRRWFGPKHYVAIKIGNCNTVEHDKLRESAMNQHLGTANPNHPGYSILSLADRVFWVESPRGLKHPALVLRPLRESLRLLRRRLAYEGEPVALEFLGLIKLYISIILEGLDYMHTECHVIHTSLTLNNIMMTFGDDMETTIEDFLEDLKTTPMAMKKIGNRVVYRCRLDPFGPIKSSDFRSMIWELVTGNSLFSQEGEGLWSPAQHLADMIALLGPVPPNLIRRGQEMSHWRWAPKIHNIGYVYMKL
ncbi:hypothetical protein CDD80_1190 [Ophiocordyceps camponoti-rufipedis]|uniref:non-specific serine/threonine protein kinase n=1 Tax=Ophiocordyceps camponoti-rufipedis TaxID=2004952 RepID=A0A2C5ZAT9_9HYPO|nr:hypothetical protein CDD80_1190 [Ophiocordyceps camponoti-rufipedis]